MGWIKYTGLLVVVLLQVRSVQAQGKLKTMLEQVAALQGYTATAEKGYRIAEEGVHMVRDIKSGEFDLHKAFFGSLERVDAGVLKSPVLEEAWQYAVLSDDQEGQQALRVLTTDGGLAMTDGERLRQIMGIRNELRVRYGQVRRMRAVKDWLAAQQQKEEAYLQTLKKMYGY